MTAAKKKTKANNDHKIYMHCKQLANTDDSKSLSDIGLVFSNKAIPTKLLHYPVIRDVNKDMGPKATIKATV